VIGDFLGWSKRFAVAGLALILLLMGLCSANCAKWHWAMSIGCWATGRFDVRCGPIVFLYLAEIAMCLGAVALASSLAEDQISADRER